MISISNLCRRQKGADNSKARIFNFNTNVQDEPKQSAFNVRQEALNKNNGMILCLNVKTVLNSSYTSFE